MSAQDEKRRAEAAAASQTEWGRWGSATAHQRYVVLIPARWRNRRRCHCGCGGKCSHAGMANGVTLASGCELSMPMGQDRRLPHPRRDRTAPGERTGAVMEFGYARVSTTHQDLERQLVALREYGIPEERIYTDRKTGATMDRPGWGKLQQMLREGDRIVATNLDRYGRNLRECLNIVHDLREQGVGIKTLKDPIPIDTGDASPMAEIAVALLALFAHMERVFMHERAAHAREVAAARGVRAGRPRKLTTDQLAAAQAALGAGQKPESVAAAFGVSRATLYRYLAEAAEVGSADGKAK